jgi:DNA replication protein DnaC
MFKFTDDDIKKKVRRISWIKASSIPAARIGWLLEDCAEVDTKDITTVKKWLKTVADKKVIRELGGKGCGKGLMFYGTPGQGKTTLALSIIQEAMLTFPMDVFDVKEGRTLIRPCYFITFNDIIDLKGSMMDGPTDDEQVLYQGILGDCQNDAYNIRILVIDDIGKEHASLSGWQKNMLHHVLRTRFNNGLPTIVTTNIKREDWAGLYGDATESFVNEAFTYVPITSKRGDLRK